MTDFNTANGFLLENIKDDETTPLTQQPPVACPHDSAKATQSKERVWVVFRCSFIASLASLLAGMAGGFTSPALLELSNENLTIPTQYFNSSSILPSVFGVSKMRSENYLSTYNMHIHSNWSIKHI